jgi:hypothetical protein
MSRIFKGLEVEGPDRGEPTLFIPKNAINRFSFMEIAKKHKLKRLYFGAGNDRGIATDLVPFLNLIPDDFKVLLEITDFNQLFFLPFGFVSKTQIIYVLKVIAGFFIKMDIFKIETDERVIWYNLKKPIVTSLTDPLYEKDE